MSGVVVLVFLLVPARVIVLRAFRLCGEVFRRRTDVTDLVFRIASTGIFFVDEGLVLRSLVRCPVLSTAGSTTRVAANSPPRSSKITGSMVNFTLIQWNV